MNFRLAYLYFTLSDKDQGPEQPSPISTANTLEMEAAKLNYCHQIESCIRAFDYHIYILPWLVLHIMVKVMKIFT